MRLLSRSEFDRFADFLLHLYSFHEGEPRHTRPSANLNHLIHAEAPGHRRKDLGPYLRRALKDARGMLRLLQQSAQFDIALKAMDLDAIRVDRTGRILDPDLPGARLLSTYCSLGPAHRLPGRMGEWFVTHRSESTHDGASQFPRSVTLESDRGELTVSLLKGEDDWWLLLQERRSLDLQSRLREAGLTVREAEVLFWVVKGKTNDEVAAILETKSATIKKHLKGIYVKFGVDSRVAAVGHARALGRPGSEA